MGFFGLINFKKSNSIIKPSSANLVDLDDGFICINDWDLHELQNAICVFHPSIIARLPDTLLDKVTVFSSNEIGIEEFQNTVANLNQPFSWAMWYDGIQFLLVRNTFGTIPIYYSYQSGQFLAFSTNLPELVKIIHPFSNLSVNTEKVNDYLSFQRISNYDEKTFFSEINNLLPGYIAHFTNYTCLARTYVNFTQDQWLNLDTSKKLSQAFRNLFIRSIKRSISPQEQIGAHLSGGLDSSSIVSSIRHIYKQRPIFTFYSDNKSKWTNEDKYAEHVAVKTNSVHHSVTPPNNHLDALNHLTSLTLQPQYMINGAAKHIGIIKYAKELGCNILLTGHDGDSIVGFGKEYLTELYIQSDWAMLKMQLSNLAQFDHMNKIYDDWTALSLGKREEMLHRRFFSKLFVKNLKTFSLRELTKILKVSNRFFKIKPAFFAKTIYCLALDKISKIDIVPSTVSNITIKRSLKKQQIRLFSEESKHLRPGGIANNSGIRVSEEYYALGENFKISLRHPFFDPQLYSLSLITKSDVKYNNGTGRGLLREAMKGILPELVRLRTDKAILSFYARRVVIELLDESSHLLSENALIWSYVDKKLFDKVVKLLRDDQQPHSVHHIMIFFCNQTISLAVWLEQVESLLNHK